MEEQQKIQQGSAGELTFYSILLLVDASRGLCIQVEHSPKVSPQVERARMVERSQEVQQEQTGPKMDIGVALHKPKKNVRQLEQYGFKKMVSYTW